MALAGFIRENIESILAEWEAFAVTLSPAAETMTSLALRNHAREILLAIARDIDAGRLDSGPRALPSHGSTVAAGAETAAAAHGALRQRAGFDLAQHAAEYRALRASVLRLWREHVVLAQESDLADVMCFTDAVDQALAESVASYAREMMRSRDTFLAILGHDLRSPLSAISMSAHYLAASGRVAPDDMPALARISQSTLTMNLLIRDLLEFTRTRLGKRIPVVTATHDIALLCEDAHDEVQAACPDCVVDLELSGDLHAQVDAARLRQVLSNLLNNAVQYGDAGVPIALSARGDADAVVVEVHNQGPAIPAEALQVIFDPLVQVADGDTRPADPLSTSLGLGLFIAHEIVIRHGGTLRVTSTRAEGTAFTVTLPRTGGAS